MENGNGNGGGAQTISCEDVISKLKDDGDFDRLRLKIIRKLKENVHLWRRIGSSGVTTRQSKGNAKHQSEVRTVWSGTLAEYTTLSHNSKKWSHYQWEVLDSCDGRIRWGRRWGKQHDQHSGTVND